MKLPDLIEHFANHENEDQDYKDSFFDFIKEHYSYSSSHNNLANSSHKNLPFKTVDAHSPHIVMMNFQLNNFSFLKVIPLIKQKVVSYDNSTIPSAYLEGIWQPPRFC